MKLQTNKTKKSQEQVIDIVKISLGRINFCVLGTAPLVMNRMNEKARQELLLPALKKTRAEKNLLLKHNPTEEFRLAVYRTLNGESPTRIVFPGGGFAKALGDTAIDMPGATKSQIQRLVRVPDINISIFGIPRLYMATVRMADMNKTPDIRTRAIFPEWACHMTFTYVRNLITERSITNLFAASGILCGIGDGRGQKGGAFGLYQLVEESNKDFQRIIKTQSKLIQDQALEEAIPYDHETEELYSWWKEEMIIREKNRGEDELPVAA